MNTLQDLLIFDGKFNIDQIKKENFYEGDNPMKIKKSSLTVNFCNIIYFSDWYDLFWEKVKGTDFRWYGWTERLKYLKNPESIKEASVEDIYKLLILIIRMEYWNVGFVYRSAKKGVIFAILNRIKDIKVGELY